MKSESPYKIWTNHDLTEQQVDWLREHLAPHHLVLAGGEKVNNLTAGESDPECVTADIAFGQPSVDDILASRDLKWIHITSAGYTRYDRADLRDCLLTNEILFTNSSSVYDDPCAQHVLAMMLTHNRLLIASAEFTKESAWEYDKLRPIQRILGGEKVLIVGYGAIGQRLTELLQPFGCEVIGLRREPNGTELALNHPISEVDKYLGWADHVVNILPAHATTDRFFDAPRFFAMQKGAAFYNIGRGDTVDQGALITALEAGQISAAYLDVTSPEPLPADHPLWSAPNCLITPHVAGGMQNEMDVLLKHFVDNFALFADGLPVKDKVRSLNA